MTSELEKLILKGKAESKTLSCFGAQFYALTIPSNQTIVITQIDWTPFINFPIPDGRYPSLNELTLYSQYQLKISDDKNSNFLHFDNQINLTPVGNAGSYDASTDIDRWLNNHLIAQSGAMITIPCYFPIQNELRMAITRGYPQYINSSIDPLAARSKEPFYPDGVKGISQPVWLYMVNQQLNYQPTQKNNTNVVPSFEINKSDGFYYGTDAANLFEPIHPPDYYPFHSKIFTQPQFVIHYTIIKENLMGIID